MSWPVYTETFVRRRSLGAGTWNWVVPAGKRAIVKSIVVTQTGGQAGIAEVLVGNVAVFLATIPATAVSHNVELLAVGYPGEIVGVYASQPDYDVSVSGWLLDESQGGMDRLERPTWEFESEAAPRPS